MLKRTLRYLWGKKFMLIVLVLVIFLLPNIISRDLQVRTVPVITSMTIDTSGDEIAITAQKLKASPGEQSIQYETVDFRGTDIKAMLGKVSLAHCTAIEFTGEPDVAILQQIYNYRDLRANTTVNQTQTIDEILKNQGCCCPQS